MTSNTQIYIHDLTPRYIYIHTWLIIFVACYRHFNKKVGGLSYILLTQASPLKRQYCSTLVSLEDLLLLVLILSNTIKCVTCSPPVFSGDCDYRSLVLCVCFVDRCLFFCTFLVFVLSALLWFTDSDYPIGIFKLFLYVKMVVIHIMLLYP